MAFLAGQRLTAGQLNQLAEDSLFVGTELISFTSQDADLRTVNFGATLAAPPSIVLAVISSGAGVTRGWSTRTDTYTTTSFRLILSTEGTAVTWTDVPVRWHAIGTVSLP